MAPLPAVMEQKSAPLCFQALQTAPAPQTPWILQRRSQGRNQCQGWQLPAPLAPPECGFKMGTESCQEFTSLNQTIFSQAGKGNLAAACRETGGDPSGDAGSTRPQGKQGFCSATVCSAKAETEVTSSLRAENVLSESEARNGVFSAGPGSDKPTSKHIFLYK